MDREHLDVLAFELLEFMKGSEASHPDRWVPAAEVRDELNLRFYTMPREGWIFMSLTRMLEDEGLLECRNDGYSAFYRSKRG
jgi:hypothetical protein